MDFAEACRLPAVEHEAGVRPAMAQALEIAGLPLEGGHHRARTTPGTSPPWSCTWPADPTTPPDASV